MTPAASSIFDPEKYPRPAVTVDIAVMTLIDGAFHVLLIERGTPPFEGALALPGGFLKVEGPKADADLDAAATRELEEETGIVASDVDLTQVETFGAPGRDPRMRVITVAYSALLRPEVAARVQAGSDARAVCWRPVSTLKDEHLAFDHQAIIESALGDIRFRLDFEPVAFSLCPLTFTARELQDVYEAIGGAAIDAGNFQRRLKRMVARRVVEKAPGRRETGKRPAALYRFVREAER